MENELPTEAAPAAEQQAEEIPQNANTGSDLAPDKGDNPEEKQATEGELAQAAINKQHKRFRDEERGHQDTKTQLQEAQQKLTALQADQPEPIIPPMPDSFDDNFDELVKQRDAAIVAVTQHNTQQGIAAQTAQSAENDRALEGQRQAQADADTLSTNAVKQGIKIEDLNVAAAKVGEYHLDPALVVELMTNEDGPVMIAHLAANPMELDALRQLPLGQAFGVLHGKIRTAAQALKPKTSDAPDPPELLGGDGKPEGDNRPMIAGASFE